MQQPACSAILPGAGKEPQLPREIKVDAVDEGRRLERYLAKLDGGLPPSLVRRLLRQRRVRVNDRRVRDGALLLHAGDQLQIHHDFTQSEAQIDDRRWRGPSVEVLHQDKDFLVLNKPAGVACSDDGADESALQVWLREHLSAEIDAGRARPEPCHRLDRETTGVVVVALGPVSFDRFRRALEDGQVRKVYEVAVRGVPTEESFQCDLALQRSEGVGRDEPRMVPGQELDALTRFRLITSRAGRSLLEAVPVTGRTHQIRAHCLALDLPVIGDRRYNPQRAGDDPPHQLLHARRLQLDGEGGFDLQAAWPPDRRAWLQEAGLWP
ncbi:hypothetical protein DRQ53_01505 [bacterium]|nr:MAG: hypothetical protein DRQ53_01505 [bacterium]